jgi:hypothetical protein
MTKKAKLPKRIAGVKIPKRIRKGPLGQFLCSRAGQAMLAEALLIASGTFAAKRVVETELGADEPSTGSDRDGKRADRAAGVDGGDGEQLVGFAAERLARAGAAALRAFRTALSDDAEKHTGEEVQSTSEAARPPARGEAMRAASEDAAIERSREVHDDAEGIGKQEIASEKKKTSSSRAESETSRH